MWEHTHTRLTALFPGLPEWAGTRKVKPIWILLKQETVSGSGISWAICKSASRSRQMTTPAPHCSVFYRPYALPATQPTASKHWRQYKCRNIVWKSHNDPSLLYHFYQVQIIHGMLRQPCTELWLFVQYMICDIATWPLIPWPYSCVTCVSGFMWHNSIYS